MYTTNSDPNTCLKWYCLQICIAHQVLLWQWSLPFSPLHLSLHLQVSSFSQQQLLGSMQHIVPCKCYGRHRKRTQMHMWLCRRGIQQTNYYSQLLCSIPPAPNQNLSMYVKDFVCSGLNRLGVCVSYTTTLGILDDCIHFLCPNGYWQTPLLCFWETI